MKSRIHLVPKGGGSSELASSDAAAAIDNQPPMRFKQSALVDKPPEAAGATSPMPHPFIISSIRVISASGAVREINPREWPRYGWEKPC